MAVGIHMLSQVDSNNVALVEDSDVYVSTASTSYKDYGGVINGTTIARGLKMNSSGSVTFTIKQKMILTVYMALNDPQGHGLVFTNTNGNTYKIDHTENTEGSGYKAVEITLEAGEYTMTRCCSASKEFSLGGIVFTYA